MRGEQSHEKMPNGTNQGTEQLEQLQKFTDKLEAAFMPRVEAAAVASGLRLNDILTIEPESHEYRWDLSSMNGVLAEASRRSPVRKDDFMACKQAWKNEGVSDWPKNFNGKAYITAVTTVMKQQVLWGALDERTVGLFRRLPFKTAEIPAVQKDWLAFMLAGKKNLAPEALRRACEVYGNIATEYFYADPSVVKPRGVFPESGKPPVSVSAHAQGLLDSKLKEAAQGPIELVDAGRRTYQINAQDIRAVQEMSFRGGAAAEVDKGTRAQRALEIIADSHPSLGKAVSTVGVAALGAGLAVVPAAAETSATSSSVSQKAASANGLNVAAPSAVSYAFVHTVSSSPNQAPAAGDVVAIPLSTSPLQATPIVSASQVVETIQPTEIIPVADMAKLGVGLSGAMATAPITAEPLHKTTQTTAPDIDPLQHLREGGITQAEQAEAAALLGLDSASVLPEQTAETAPGENKGKPELTPNPLSDANFLLNELVTEKINLAASNTDVNGTNEVVVAGESYRTALMYLKGAQGNVGALAAITAEQKQRLVADLSPAQQAVVKAREADMLAQIQDVENGAGIGLSEAQLKDFAALLAITSLGAETADTSKDLIAQAQAKIDKAEADRISQNIDEEKPNPEGFGENAPKAPEEKGEQKPAGTSLEKANKDQLLDLVKATAKKFKWSNEQEMFFEAAVLEGYPIAPACLACGSAGNSNPESDGFKANVEEYGNGIGLGLFQHSFERRDALEAAAKEEGVDLTVNNLANYRFQLKFSKNEMKKRTLRDGGDTTEWELFTSIKDPGELAWKFQYNFERPKHEDRQSNRTEFSEKVWKQLSGTWKEISKPKAAAQPKAPEQSNDTSEEAKKSGEIYEKLPADIKQRIKWINENVKRDGAHLKEKVDQNETALEKKYGNGNIPKSELVLVDNRDHYMSPTAALAFEGYNALFKSIYGRDIEIGGKRSAFRTIQQQKELKISEGDFAAEPGTSRHGVGKALDLRLHGGKKFASDEAKFHQQYGPLFGFYTPVGLGPDSDTPEAWHIEFFGDV